MNKIDTPNTNQIYQAPASMSQATSTHNIMPNNKTWYHFSGRIGRLRYLSYQFFMIITFYVILLFLLFITGLTADVDSLDSNNTLFVIILTVFILPLYIISTIYTAIIYPKRRLNDLGRSGWFQLAILIPFLNLILIIFLVFAKGDEGVNQYGAPPRENRTIHYIGALILPFIFIVSFIVIMVLAIPAYDGYLQQAGASSQQLP